MLEISHHRVEMPHLSRHKSSDGPKGPVQSLENLPTSLLNENFQCIDDRGVEVKPTLKNVQKNNFKLEISRLQVVKLLPSCHSVDEWRPINFQ